MMMKRTTPCQAYGRCRTERGAERLRQLQAAAAEMFLRWGYEGVSVDMLIERVGGSRRNVYGPYGSKQGLFEQAVRGLSEGMACPLQSLPMDELATRQGLSGFGRALLQMLLQPRTLDMHRLMIAEAQRFPDLAHSLCASQRDNTAAGLGAWMAERQRRGDLRRDVAAVTLAHQFMNLVVCGPQLRALVGEMPPGWIADGMGRHVDDCVDLFLHGAAAPPATSPPPAA